jgi:sugar lactone lactonase YvrE
MNTIAIDRFGMPAMTPRAAVAAGNELGESVLWSVANQEVFWIDGFAPAIHRWSPATNRHRVVPLAAAPIGMIVATTDPDSVVLTDRDGVALFDLESGTRTGIADPERGRDGIGYNDAKVDRFGRLWVGTYDASEVEPRGCLWLLEHGRVPRLAESGMAVVNGPSFSPDGRAIYISDSIARRILAFDVKEDGSLAGRRVLAQFNADEGLPDGLTVDAQGSVWCAHWDGGRVTRFSPQGERTAVIRLPATRVTSVAFGGPELDMLFITTARYGLTEAQLSGSPGAGSLFLVKPGVRGIPATPLLLPFACA